MTIDLDELERAANAATVGPWKHPAGTHYVDFDKLTLVCHNARDAAFIAAANPATVVELIDEVRTARAILQADPEVHRAVFQSARLYTERMRKLEAALMTATDVLYEVRSCEGRLPMSVERLDEWRKLATPPADARGETP